MPCNFFALLEDGTIRKILLTQEVSAEIQRIFLDLGEAFLCEDTEETAFEGNYLVGDNEVLYVNMVLNDNFRDVPGNSISIQTLDLNNERIKALFWFEDGQYYFQNFDNRKLLRNKNIFVYSNQTYSKLEENAFIVDNVINAIHTDGIFYFKSYANANKIFSLANFYQEATDEDIKSFCSNRHIIADSEWLIKQSNTAIRKQITLLQRSGIMRDINVRKVKTAASKFNLTIELEDHKICLPNDKKRCREILTFLNEQYYVGLITKNKYKTNSKKSIS